MRPDRSQKTSTLADVIPNWAGTPIRFWRRFTQEESGLQFLHQRPVPDATTVSRLKARLYQIDCARRILDG
jgi:hypothetical protein